MSSSDESSSDESLLMRVLQMKVHLMKNLEASEKGSSNHKNNVASMKEKFKKSNFLHK